VVIGYAKSGETKGGRKGRRGSRRWRGSFHDSVELQPCCLGEGEGERQILEHVDQALRGVVARDQFNVATS